MPDTNGGQSDITRDYESRYFELLNANSYSTHYILKRMNEARQLVKDLIDATTPYDNPEWPRVVSRAIDALKDWGMVNA